MEKGYYEIYAHLFLKPSDALSVILSYPCRAHFALGFSFAWVFLSRRKHIFSYLNREAKI